MSYPIYVPNIKGTTAELIDDEIHRAKAKFPVDFHNAHEGFAVLKEEAVQVAAMAIRFINELTK